MAAPTYISEISTPRTRGRLVALYQFNIVFGILIAFLSNYFLTGIGGANDWRWMLGVMAVPSLLYTLLVLGIPESPRWLIARKNDTEGARKVLKRLGTGDIDAIVSSVNAARQAGNDDHKATGFFSDKYKTVIWLAFMLATFVGLYLIDRAGRKHC